MKTNPHDFDEAAWQAQEKARRLEPDADADELRITRALRRTPKIDLPFDFAAQVAAKARAQAVVESALEQRLLRALVVVFALSAAVVVAWFGRGWAADAIALLGRDEAAWCGVTALCLLANWSFGALRRQFRHGAHALA